MNSSYGADFTIFRMPEYVNWITVYDNEVYKEFSEAEENLH